MAMADNGERLPLINDVSINGSRRYGDGTGDSHWEFAGRGTKSVVDNLTVDEEGFHRSHEEKKEHHLGQLLATAIAGNDITSSCLYTIGLCIAVAGKWAPVSLAIVVVVLIFYQRIYAEVGSAIPLNGGAYNCLLNTTSKYTASLAAVLAILAYVATAVVSADSAIQYLNFILDNHANHFQVNGLWATICLLAIFGILNMIGVGESAVVAFGIFAMHVTVLTILAVAGCVRLFQGHWEILQFNWDLPSNINTAADIFFGFCVAMLGVTGFETSSNYIEEQKAGVFPQTLRNMIIIVGLFNPLLAFLTLSFIRLPISAQTSPQVLALMGQEAAGPWLGWVVGLDAVLVLSGSILTAYVGVTGLLKRMSLDRVLPQFFLQENPCRRTNHWIIIGFFVICTSLYEAVSGNVTTLSGVYTVSFLSVLALFAIGNLFLKYKRSRLPRDTRAPVVIVVIGFGMVVSALIGNIVRDLTILAWFTLYFSVTAGIVLLMLTRTRLLRWAEKSFLGKCCGTWLQRQVHEINDHEMIFFAKTDNLEILNKAVLYVRDNELTNCFRVVHVYESEEKIPPHMSEYVNVLDKMYPKIKIDLTLVKGTFSPATVAEIAKALDVPRNFMYLTCPSDRFKHNISLFGGVRLITH